MTEKYYTPQIEEFHIGFEYETYNTSVGYIITDYSEGDFNYSEVKTPNEKMWFKENFRLPCMPLDTWSDLKEINKRIEEGRIRVKYLDESDLLELGWGKDGNIFKIVEGYYDKEDDLTGFEYNLRIDKFGLYITKYMISYGEAVVPYEGDNYIFQGQVKNKTEMKKLMEMLNIKTT